MPVSNGFSQHSKLIPYLGPMVGGEGTGIGEFHHFSR